MRQAGAALARPEAGPRRALEELELRVALVEGRREVVDRRAHARADDALGRRRRERVVDGGRADRGDRIAGGHPGEDVARRQPEIDDHGVAGLGRLGPVVVRRSRRRSRGRRSSPSKRTGGRLTVTVRPRSTRRRGGARRPARSRSRRNPLPGQTGWISAEPVATTISFASRWSIPPGTRATIDGAGVDPDDLRPVHRVEHDDVAAGRPGGVRRGRPLGPPPTTARSVRDRWTGIAAPPGTLARSRRSTVGRGGLPSAGWRSTTVPGRAATWQVRTYATPSTVARQLPQSPARQSAPPRPGTSPARTIAIATESPASNSIGRPSTTTRPSVTGASGAPAGRRAARAGAGPDGAGR